MRMEIDRTPSLVETAEQLLTRAFVRADDSVSRLNMLNSLAGQGRDQRPARLRFAEAWQLLERAGLICRDPDQHQGDWWFLTGAGKAALRGGDVQGSIMLATKAL